MMLTEIKCVRMIRLKAVTNEGFSINEGFSVYGFLIVN